MCSSDLVHEDVPRQILSKFWINKYLRKSISLLFEKYEDFISAQLSGIITATPHISKRFKLINYRTITVNNYPIINELSNPINWSLKKQQVCYIGSISSIRGNKHLVEAMNYFTDEQLVMAGKFSNSTFKMELQNTTGWKNVNYIGNVDRKEVADVLSESKAGMVTFLPLPNHVDAQPNKMFEYMSAGIPVIASNFPLWRDIIEKNQCGICVDPSNISDLVNAITKVLSNNTLAQEMGENGKSAVQNIYNWQVEFNKLVEFYKELVKK